VSIQEVKAEVETWPITAREELAVHLSMLALREDKALAEEMAVLVDDRRPESWLSAEQMDERLGFK
jgi:hypothetical protein